MKMFYESNGQSFTRSNTPPKTWNPEMDRRLARMRLDCELEPISPRHIEMMRPRIDDTKINPWINIVIICLGILIAGAMIAAVLPHN